jgi:pimeloyl-ACP methyl ester carboxylesterase
MSAPPREKAMAYGATTPLTGVLTLPARLPPPGRPVVVFLNAGLIHHVGPNRLHVTLSRALAAAGYVACRFDLAGIGDSPHRGDGLPIPDGVAADIAATLDHLEATLGARRFVLFGLCAGADNALAAAAADPRVVGAVLLDPSIHRTPAWYRHYYAGRALRPESWKSVLTGRHPRVAAAGRPRLPCAAPRAPARGLRRARPRRRPRVLPERPHHPRAHRRAVAPGAGSRHPRVRRVHPGLDRLL